MRFTDKREEHQIRPRPTMSHDLLTNALRSEKVKLPSQELRLAALAAAGGERVRRRLTMKTTNGTGHPPPT